MKILYFILLFFTIKITAQCLIPATENSNYGRRHSNEAYSCNSNCGYQNLGTIPPNFFQDVCPVWTQNLVLVIDEQFDTGDYLDESYWNKSHYHLIKPEMCHEPQNIKVEDGILKLSAYSSNTSCYDRGNPALLRDAYYSSGEITSKYLFGPGKLEIRAKMPYVDNHFWPALWLYTEDGNADEIDLVEFIDDDDDEITNRRRPFFSIHSTSDIDSDCWCRDSKVCLLDDSVDYSEDFHTYTLIWDYSRIQWYMDGILRREVYNYYTIIWVPIFYPPFVIPFFIPVRTDNSFFNFLQGNGFPLFKSNLSIESEMRLIIGNGVSIANNSIIVPSDDVEVDYIKVWQWTDKCDEDVSIDITGYDWKKAHVFIGKSINFYGSDPNSWILRSTGTGEGPVSILCCVRDSVTINSAVRTRPEVWTGFNPTFVTKFINCP